MSTALLTAHQVSKKFGDFTAVDAVSLTLRAGEIHALLGENGAGKSTLVKMFYGSLQPTAGEILWRGAPLRVENPAQARALGIAMVFQHFSLFEALTVAENIALALPHGPSLADLSARMQALEQFVVEKMICLFSVGIQLENTPEKTPRKSQRKREQTSFTCVENMRKNLAYIRQMKKSLLF